uniref:Fucoxanthin-chlorophyll a/c light-harvesting protein n=1 Tax=Ditylum brightwellii TaxID=49249 RepID=A0A7S4RF03_9STRA
MMKLAIAALLAGSAAAFAPASQKASSSALSMGFESELGAQPPLGLFDPLGMLADADQDRFDRLRYVELKHGRISQLAFLGQITTRAGIRLPGDIDYSGTSFSDIGEGWAGSLQVPVAGALQILAFVGFLELGVMKDIEGTGNEHVGDFRNGALDFGWDTFDEETKLSKRAIELNNGRAAMMGILGLMVHEQLGGSVPIVGEL